MKKAGFTLLEVLIGMLLLIFVMLAFLKGITDLNLFLKANNINKRANELAETINFKLLSKPYDEIKNCFNSSVETGYLSRQTNASNTTFTFTFDNKSFYNNTPYYPGHCTSCSDFHCLYCYIGEKLEPSNTATCDSGYPIKVKYHGATLLDTLTNKEIGFVVGVSIEYQEPKTKREKYIRFLVYKKKNI